MCFCRPSLTVCESVKQIVAIVKPYLAEKVLESLKAPPIGSGQSVRSKRLRAAKKLSRSIYGDSEYSLAFLPKVELILWVEDSRAEEMLRKVVEVARTRPHGRWQDFCAAGHAGEGDRFLKQNLLAGRDSTSAI